MDDGFLRNVANPLLASDAVPLMSAWVSTRANKLNIRALLIKGPLASMQLLRPYVVSTDVDLLVEAHRVDDFIEELAEHGWYNRPRVTSDTPRIIELHSTTLVHDSWPIDLDIHHYWPGFLEDRNKVFDTLWESRESYLIAETEVLGLCIEDSALVLALHALRSKQGEERSRSLDQLSDTINRRSLLSIQRLNERAEMLGATQSAAPLLQRLGIKASDHSDESHDLRLWRLRTSTNGNLGAWILKVESTSGLRKLVVVFHALFLPPRELRQLHPDLPAGCIGIAAGWLRRWRTGSKAIRPTIRQVADTKRRRRPADNKSA